MTCCPDRLASCSSLLNFSTKRKFRENLHNECLTVLRGECGVLSAMYLYIFRFGWNSVCWKFWISWKLAPGRLFFSFGRNEIKLKIYPEIANHFQCKERLGKVCVWRLSARNVTWFGSGPTAEWRNAAVPLSRVLAVEWLSVHAHRHYRAYL